MYCEYLTDRSTQYCWSYRRRVLNINDLTRSFPGAYHSIECTRHRNRKSVCTLAPAFTRSYDTERRANPIGPGSHTYTHVHTQANMSK